MTFHLEENHTTIYKEIIAGLTSFITVAYIIIVNPTIMEYSIGMDFGSVMMATILATAVSTLFMGLVANFPFVVAPAMGLNTYFAFGIVIDGGHTWQEALGACFIAGSIVTLLNFFDFRQTLMNAIPKNLKIAITGGIGLFLASIGLQKVELIVADPATLVALGDVKMPAAYLTLFGICLIVILMQRSFKMAILIGILVNWIIGLFTGLSAWQGLISMPPSIAPTFLKLDIMSVLHIEYTLIILSLVFVSTFGSTSVLVSLAERGLYVNNDGKIPKLRRALYADSLGTMLSASLGTSTLTPYSESMVGLEAGGRTGLTAVVVAILFLLSLFLEPFFSSIPNFAVAPVLIVIGALMLKPLQNLDWSDLTELVPAFLILISIPLTFNIASGIALGFVSYPVIKLFSGKGKEVSPLVWAVALVFTLKFLF
ncbi:MAG: NCS2 family permease [Parachlamydiaceae bacterium]|nr:NCS2 family permease [Parachlamydiaceae bacterium]